VVDQTRYIYVIESDCLLIVIVMNVRLFSCTCVVLIVVSGADIHVKDNKGLSPRDGALQWVQKEMDGKILKSLSLSISLSLSLSLSLSHWCFSIV
jgi:hypothetical protein